MTNAKPLFENALSKIQRANRHIDELGQRSAPLDPGLYNIVYDTAGASVVDGKPTFYRLSYRPAVNIPETFAAVIQDAFNNIREAFDFTAAAIVDSWGERPARKLYFPITKRKDLVAHAGFTAIEKALPGFTELFLKEARPENGPKEHLWDFYTLQNDGKHNDFVPVLSIVEMRNFAMMVGTNRLRNIGYGYDANREFVLAQADVPITVKNDFHVAVDIRFGKGNVFENRPVLSTLAEISQLASDTIGWLDTFVRKAKNLD